MPITLGQQEGKVPAQPAGSRLGKVFQQDFSGGFWRSAARPLIDPRGLYDLQNFMLDDDGAIYRRGGSTYKSATGVGAPITFIWDGYLQAAGQRTVFATHGQFYVLGADDKTPVSLGAVDGAGVATAARGSVVGGLLFIDGGVIYGGSQKAADYSGGGTLSVVAGSATVNGTGTVFTQQVDKGMLLQIASTGRYYLVTKVLSDTQLTIKDPFEGTTGTVGAFTFNRLGRAGGAYPLSSIYAAVADRLVHCEGNRIGFSMGRDVNGQVRPHSYNAYDYHEIPGGGLITGAAASGQNLMVFATNGIWVVTNMAMNIVDFAGNPQHRVAQITDGLVLWSKEGIAEWQGSLIVPCLSGVFEMNATTPGNDVAFTVHKLTRDYARAGYRVGNAVVFRNHYFMPVLSADRLVDFLVCRLDRALRGPRGIGSRRAFEYPWTRLAGHAANVTGMAARIGPVTTVPYLLSAGFDGRVCDVSKVFEPDASVKADADGTAHVAMLETRDFATNPQLLNANLVRRLRLRYELVDAASDHPALDALVSIGQVGGLTTWGAFVWGAALWADRALEGFTSLVGGAPPDNGLHPFTWLLSTRARFIRIRVLSSGPAASLVIRSLELFIRQSAKDR